MKRAMHHEESIRLAFLFFQFLQWKSFHAGPNEDLLYRDLFYLFRIIEERLRVSENFDLCN